MQSCFYIVSSKETDGHPGILLPALLRSAHYTTLHCVTFVYTPLDRGVKWRCVILNRLFCWKRRKGDQRIAGDQRTPDTGRRSEDGNHRPASDPMLTGKTGLTSTLAHVPDWIPVHKLERQPVRQLTRIHARITKPRTHKTTKSSE